MTNPKVKTLTIAHAKKLTYARNYARIGWFVLPLFGINQDGSCACGKKDCQSPGKHPNHHLVPSGQRQATTDVATIEDWFRKAPNSNIGILLSRSSLVAIDIDPRNGGVETIEALEAVHGRIDSDVLQYTGGGGEHRVFYLDEKSHLSLPGSLGAGVDLKRNGYIVVEPSIHACGGQYCWEASSDPLEGATAAPLPDWIRDISAHKSSPSFAIAPSHQPISQNQADEIADALQSINADDRDTWLRMGMAIHTLNAGGQGFALWDDWARTSDKHNPADSVRVWRSYSNRPLDGITIRTLFATAQQNGWVNTMAANTSDPKPENDAFLSQLQADNNLPDIPCRKLCEVRDWLSGLAEKFHPEISTAGALALGSVLAGRKYKSTNDNWTALFFVVSAGSGVGKNYIQVGIERILMEAGLESRIAGDFYTHQSALYNTLKEKPCHICISDEFGENFLEARKNNNANKNTVFKALKKVYSGADHIYKAESFAAGSASDRPAIINPSLTLVGLTTPMQFYSEIKASHIEGGLINRLIVINADKNKLVRHKKTSAKVPANVLKLAAEVAGNQSLAIAADMQVVPKKVEIDAAAFELFAEFEAEQERMQDDLERYGLGSLPARWREHAMRLATMLAACDNPEKPVIDLIKANWAVEYIRKYGCQVVRELHSKAFENEHEKLMNDVLEFVGSCDQDPTMRDIYRKFRAATRKDLTEITHRLADNGEIIQFEDKPEGRGRPSVRFCRA